MADAYVQGNVTTVTGALGLLYYASVTITGETVEALVDPGSSASIMSFETFQWIGPKAGIERQIPDVVLRNYSQQPIAIGALVDLEREDYHLPGLH